MTSELIKTKALVYDVLKEIPITRNSDRQLILEILKKEGANVWVDFGQLHITCNQELFFDMPSFETITRVRRAIQNNDGEWLPTDPMVLIQRKIKEEKIRAYFILEPKVVESWQAVRYGVG